MSSLSIQEPVSSDWDWRIVYARDVRRQWETLRSAGTRDRCIEQSEAPYLLWKLRGPGIRDPAAHS
ncbi:hypothetical protein HDF11_004763 [Tunturiibacter psychrotolerans]